MQTFSKRICMHLSELVSAASCDIDMHTKTTLLVRRRKRKRTRFRIVPNRFLGARPPFRRFKPASVKPN